MPHTQTVRLFDMQFITACISTTMVLILLGLMLFLVLSAHRLSVYVRENLNFTVLLSNDAPESAILALQKRLDGEAFVKASAYISKEEALKEEDLQFLAESAHADACAPGNPKDASVEDLKELFRKLM